MKSRFKRLRAATNTFRIDLLRYPRSAWISDRSLWAVAVFRLGLPMRCHVGLRQCHTLLNLWSQIVTNVRIGLDAQIGPGLLLIHAQGAIIHPDAVIGLNCTLMQGVTIGNRDATNRVPRIGANAELGAYAQILGGIKLGDNVHVGALSVVIRDVPDNTVVAGVPARQVGTVQSSVTATTAPSP
jgi:serine O-acetyltransferase